MKRKPEWRCGNCLDTGFGTIVLRETHPIWRRKSYRDDIMRTACPVTTGFGSGPGYQGKYTNFLSDMLHEWKKLWFNETGVYAFYQTASDAVEGIAEQYDQKIHTIDGNYLSSRGRLSKRGFRRIETYPGVDLDLIIPRPYVKSAEETNKNVELAIEKLKDGKVKRILMEPIFNGRVPSKYFCEAANDLGIKIISDEAISGFGRCGVKWGHELTELKNVDGIIFGKASRLCGYFSTDRRMHHLSVTEQFIPSALIQSYHISKEIVKKEIIKRNKRIGNRLKKNGMYSGHGLFLRTKSGSRILPMWDMTEEEIKIIQSQENPYFRLAQAYNKRNR